MTHRIGVIGGDGIGPEVVAEGLKVVRAAGVELDTVDYDLGGARYLRDGVVLPDEVSTSGGASTPSSSARSARPTCRRGSSSGACC